MLKKEWPTQIGALIILLLALSALSTACQLNRRLALEPGVYKPLPNAGAAGSIKSLEVDRQNHIVTFNLTDGSRAVVSFSSRDRVEWPTGCPANIGSTYMEVLDLDDGPLTLGIFTYQDPILVRACPPDPERIALREDGPVGGAGSACTGLDKCLSLSRNSQLEPTLTAPIVSAKPLPPSMKGYELYSWIGEEGDNWRYTLITGTNRLKTVEEIKAGENQVTGSEWVKITVSGTEELIELLKRLPPGTEMFWQDRDRLEDEQPAATNIRLPESGLVEEIQNLCRQLEIQLHVSQ